LRALLANGIYSITNPPRILTIKSSSMIGANLSAGSLIHGLRDDLAGNVYALDVMQKIGADSIARALGLLQKRGPARGTRNGH
jgi:hypothetical protein